MFHTYITTSRGNRVDIDRASFLMDKTLFNQVMEELWSPVVNKVLEQWPEDDMDQACAMRMATNGLPQRFWARYCELHHEKYGQPFGPDIKPHWDR
jgi:hypothetical protein